MIYCVNATVLFHNRIEMNNPFFETCMEELATALHTDLLLYPPVNLPDWFQSNTMFLKAVLTILPGYTSSPLSLTDEDLVEKAIRDAERRILFGLIGHPHDHVFQYNYILRQLTLAFSTQPIQRLFCLF